MENPFIKRESFLFRYQNLKNLSNLHIKSYHFEFQSFSFSIIELDLYCSLNLVVLQIQMQCWNKRFYNIKKLILIMYFIFFVTICIDGDETQKSCALISIMKWSQIDLTPWGSALFIINSSHNGGPWGEVGLLGESSQWVEFSFTSQTKFQICIYYKLETRHHEWHIFPKYQSNKILWYFLQITFKWVC